MEGPLSGDQKQFGEAPGTWSSYVNGSVTIDPENCNRDPATVVVLSTDSSGALHVDQSWANAVGAPY